MTARLFRRGADGSILVIHAPNQEPGWTTGQDLDGRQPSRVRFSETDREELIKLAREGSSATAPETGDSAFIGWESIFGPGAGASLGRTGAIPDSLDGLVDRHPRMVENERCRRDVHAANPSPEEDDEMAEFVSKDAFDAHMQRIDEKIEGTMSRIEGKIDVALSRIEGEIKVLSVNDESRKEEYKIVREELISLRTMIFSMTLGLLVAIFVAAFLGR